MGGKGWETGEVVGQKPPDTRGDSNRSLCQLPHFGGAHKDVTCRLAAVDLSTVRGELVLQFVILKQNPQPIWRLDDLDQQLQITLPVAQFSNAVRA